jgi:hypothetical protein
MIDRYFQMADELPAEYRRKCVIAGANRLG